MFLEFDRRVSQEELKFVTRVTSALFWVEHDSFGRPKVRNGSASFLNVNGRRFGITASHVAEHWRQSRDGNSTNVCQLAGERASAPIDLASRIIDEDRDIDIATFEVSAKEVESLGKEFFYGAGTGWPPPPPIERQGIVFSGYPGVGTYVDPTAIVFSATPGGLVVTSINATDLLCQIDRENLTGVLAGGVPPENFAFGGISGAAMLATVITKGGIIGWSFAGIVYEGPNTDPEGSISGFEVIRGRRACFVQSDGTLDRAQWANARFAGSIPKFTR